jgi:hypothetical protein
MIPLSSYPFDYFLNLQAGRLPMPVYPQYDPYFGYIHYPNYMPSIYPPNSFTPSFTYDREPQNRN